MENNGTRLFKYIIMQFNLNIYELDGNLKRAYCPDPSYSVDEIGITSTNEM